LLHDDLLTAERDAFAGRAGGGQQGQPADGEIPLFEAEEHFLPHRAGGAGDGDVQGFTHWFGGRDCSGGSGSGNRIVRPSSRPGPMRRPEGPGSGSGFCLAAVCPAVRLVEARPRVVTSKLNQSDQTMKIVKTISLAAAAAGIFLSVSCCNSSPAPAPSVPTYVAPAK